MPPVSPSNLLTVMTIIGKEINKDKNNPICLDIFLTFFDMYCLKSKYPPASVSKLVTNPPLCPCEIHIRKFMMKEKISPDKIHMFFFSKVRK